MTPTPFCCDITSGSEQERNEFKRLYIEASIMLDGDSDSHWDFGYDYYGLDKEGRCTFSEFFSDSIIKLINIIPLSEGIAILKEMVGEGPKTKVNEHSLLPCPFCGGDCEVGMNGRSQYVVKCYPCSVSMLDDRKDKVVTNWNNRQPKP